VARAVGEHLRVGALDNGTRLPVRAEGGDVEEGEGVAEVGLFSRWNGSSPVVAEDLADAFLLAVAGHVGAPDLVGDDEQDDQPRGDRQERQGAEDAGHA
jgi:hypothetical protein